MIYYKWFYEPIYKINYYFVVCKKQEGFTSTVKKHYGTDIDHIDGAYGKSGLLISDEGKAISFVWVRTRTSYAHFAHELIHILINLFDHINHPLNPNNDEPVAYLAEYLTDQFIDKNGWKKLKRGKK